MTSTTNSLLFLGRRDPTKPYSGADYLRDSFGKRPYRSALDNTMGQDLNRATSLLIRTNLRPGEAGAEYEDTQLGRDAKNPLYIEAARKLGIKSLNSADEMAKVIRSMSGGGGGSQSGGSQSKDDEEEGGPASDAKQALTQIVNDQIKQNQAELATYQGMINDLTARLVAAENSSQAGVKAGPVGTTTTPDASGKVEPVTTTTTKAITPRKKKSLEITDAQATGLSLTI